MSSTLCETTLYPKCIFSYSKCFCSLLNRLAWTMATASKASSVTLSSEHLTARPASPAQTTGARKAAGPPATRTGRNAGNASLATGRSPWQGGGSGTGVCPENSWVTWRRTHLQPLVQWTTSTSSISSCTFSSASFHAASWLVGWRFSVGTSTISGRGPMFVQVRFHTFTNWYVRRASILFFPFVIMHEQKGLHPLIYVI